MIFLRLKGLASPQACLNRLYFTVQWHLFDLNEPRIGFNVLKLLGLLHSGEFRVHCELLSPREDFVLPLEQ